MNNFKDTIDQAIIDGWSIFISSTQLSPKYPSYPYQGRYTRELVLLQKNDFTSWKVIEGKPRKKVIEGKPRK